MSCDKEPQFLIKRKPSDVTKVQMFTDGFIILSVSLLEVIVTGNQMKLTVTLSKFLWFKHCWTHLG